MSKTTFSSRDGRSRGLGLIAVFILGMILIGCGATVRPPAAVSDPAEVYLVKRGGHISLILPVDEDDATEYAYGEWSWYATNQTHPFRVASVLIFDHPGAFGYRRLGIAAEREALMNFYGLKKAEEVNALIVERERVERLRDRFDAMFADRADEAVTNPKNQLTFIPSEYAYSSRNTCNTMVARWLGELDVTVEGNTSLAEWRIVREE